jgi:hypothetical protein
MTEALGPVWVDRTGYADFGYAVGDAEVHEMHEAALASRSISDYRSVLG